MGYSTYGDLGDGLWLCYPHNPCIRCCVLYFMGPQPGAFAPRFQHPAGDDPISQKRLHLWHCHRLGHIYDSCSLESPWLRLSLNQPKLTCSSWFTLGLDPYESGISGGLKMAMFIGNIVINHQIWWFFPSTSMAPCSGSSGSCPPCRRGAVTAEPFCILGAIQREPWNIYEKSERYPWWCPQIAKLVYN